MAEVLLASPSAFEMPENKTPLRKRMLAFYMFIGALIGASSASESFLGVGNSARLPRRRFLGRFAGVIAAGAFSGGTIGIAAEDLPHTIRNFKRGKADLS